MTNNSAAPFQRYIPLACWMVVLLCGLFICLKIVGYGYMPAGDARRHVAKPFAHKPYSQIVIMRPEYVIDHSPGWEWLLGALNKIFGWQEDALMSFSITSLILLILWLPLLWLRRPEAWLAAILAEMIAIPELMTRWTQARPYLVTEAVFIALLFAWRKGTSDRHGWSKLIWSTAGIGLAVWMHGSWYLWALAVGALFLAQRWRDCIYLTACWLAGALIAGLLTGNPASFLYEAVFQAHTLFAEHLPWWMLVGELQPSEGEFATLVLLALVFLWSESRRLARPALVADPVFWMIAVNWILGFFADRFWADFGMPAALVWMASQFDEGLPAMVENGSLKRLVLCGMIAAPLFIDATNDLNRRYTSCLDEIYIDANDPRLRGWFPEPGGIFYSDNMKFFYNTFCKNPAGDWRYIEGFEPALMLPEDLKVYRDIQRNRKAPQAYEPWVRKMRPADRLETEGSYQPDISELEWTHIGNVWIGRLPEIKPERGKH